MRVHGLWQIRTTPSRVVVIKAWDHWNVEAAQRYSEQIHNAADGLGGKPWATFIDLLDWGLAIPEAEHVFQDLNRWGIEHGCIRVAQVTGHKALIEYQRRRVAIDTPTGFKTVILDDVSEAAAWLSSEGFALSLEEVQLSRPE